MSELLRPIIPDRARLLRSLRGLVEPALPLPEGDTLCPHVARVFDRRDSGVFVWRCCQCALWGLAATVEAFDAQAGCLDWRRGICEHGRCAQLRAAVREEG
jgi:hypothetical protein